MQAILASIMNATAGFDTRAGGIVHARQITITTIITTTTGGPGGGADMV